MNFALKRRLVEAIKDSESEEELLERYRKRDELILKSLRINLALSLSLGTKDKDALIELVKEYEREVEWQSKNF